VDVAHQEAKISHVYISIAKKHHYSPSQTPTKKYKGREGETKTRERFGASRRAPGNNIAYLGLELQFYFVLLLAYLHTTASTATRGPREGGDRDVENVPLLTSPDGDGEMPIKLPAGAKNAPFASSDGGNPRKQPNSP
jgi:hypothetical protein